MGSVPDAVVKAVDYVDQSIDDTAGAGGAVEDSSVGVT